MKRPLHLLIIDPQNDFCDLPAAPSGDGVALAPALPVPGAHGDMLRLADLIDAGRHGLSALSVTLDAHHRYDIAHPTFWIGADGQSPAPFTQIAADDVRAGRFLPRALAYLDALEATGRYRLMVWPVHCEIGTWGQNVHAAVRAAYNRWEDARQDVVAKISKGANPWSEHYSALMAEVPDAADPASQRNDALLARLARSDRVSIGGEAGSHCVRASTEHTVGRFGAGRPERVLLTDCMSPVAGFEAPYQDFLRAMQSRGVRLARSAEALAELLDNGPP